MEYINGKEEWKKQKKNETVIQRTLKSQWNIVMLTMLHYNVSLPF